jgi:hypothetical protein
MAMSFTNTIPFLLSILVGFLLGLVTVGVLRLRRHPADDASAGIPDDVLVGFLALAAFALGVFLTYVLLGAFLRGY